MEQWTTRRVTCSTVKARMQAVLVRRRQSSLGSCFCSMFGLEEGAVTDAVWSGISSAPDLFFHFGFGGLGAEP